MSSLSYPLANDLITTLLGFPVRVVCVCTFELRDFLVLGNWLVFAVLCEKLTGPVSISVYGTTPLTPSYIVQLKNVYIFLWKFSFSPPLTILGTLVLIPNVGTQLRNWVACRDRLELEREF